MLNNSIKIEETTTLATRVLASSLFNYKNDEQNSLNEVFIDTYDYTGALVYLVLIILFYSISIIAIIRIQTKRRNDYYDYDDDDDHNYYRPESVLRRMKSENTTRQALEDLRNPEIRKKLWNVYRDHLDKSPNSNTIKNKKDLSIVENKKIQAIERKLNQMNKNVPGSYLTIDNSVLNTQRPTILRQTSVSPPTSVNMETIKKRFEVIYVDEITNNKDNNHTSLIHSKSS